MSKTKKVLMSLGMALLAAVSILGTLAYLTDEEMAENTFTVGQVDILVDEAKVDTEGVPVVGAERVTSNQYHLIPGMTYTKDPTMTVVKGGEEAYVRMLVNINCASALDAIFAPSGADLMTIFNDYDSSSWLYEGVSREGDVITYEFRYKETVIPSETADITLEPLFQSITVPSELDGDDMESIADLKITIEGHAIQKAGIQDEDTAWLSFDKQMSN